MKSGLKPQGEPDLLQIDAYDGDQPILVPWCSELLLFTLSSKGPFATLVDEDDPELSDLIEFPAQMCAQRCLC